MKQTKNHKHIIIIGGGIAGLSAAYYALKAGHNVELHESTAQLGGRCRSFFDTTLGINIDNGNHLLLGCNKNALQLIEELGQKEAFHCIKNLPMKDLDSNTEWVMASNLILQYIKQPIPHISRQNITKSLWNLFFNNQAFSRDLNNPSLNINIYLWYPFITSICNTTPPEVSLKTLKHIIKTLALSPKGLYAYYPKTHWQDALILPLEKAILEKGGKIYTHSALKNITIEKNHITSLNLSNKEQPIEQNNHIVFALPTTTLKSLFSNIFQDIKYQPITNIHFKINNPKNIAIMGLTRKNADWCFAKQDHLSTTKSCSNNLLEQKNDQIIQETWKNIAEITSLDAKNIPPHRLVTEKRATFSCTTNFNEQHSKIIRNINNYGFVGDYMSTPLPACIEAAISSSKLIIKYIKQ